MALNVLEWTTKMIPGNEYLVFGGIERRESLNHTARYGQLNASTISPVINDASARIQRSISGVRSDYWCSSNAEQVIWDFFVDYRNYLYNQGFVESYLAWSEEIDIPEMFRD